MYLISHIKFKGFLKYQFKFKGFYNIILSFFLGRTICFLFLFFFLSVYCIIILYKFLLKSIQFLYFLEEFRGMFLFCFRFIAMSQINNKNQEQFGFRYFPIIFFGKNNLFPKNLNRNCLPYFIFLFFSILNNGGMR